jgi:hypothetical protein
MSQRNCISRLAAISFLALLAPACAIAQSSQTDQQAYCSYMTEQAQAQSDLLRTPTALGGFTQPDTGLPIQLVAGAELSLSGYRRGGITLDVARDNCALYRSTTAVQQYLQYALPNIEKDALQNRLELIDKASQSLNALIDKASKMVDAQNLTRPMLWGLQTNKIKLAADRADTESKLSAIYVPTLAAEPLKAQVEEKQQTDISEQRALDKLNRQNNWDVALTVGAHQQLNPVANGVQPYGEVTVSYNLASHAIDKHLDRAVDDYANWKKVQEGDSVRSMEELHTQITENIAAQERRLKSLQEESQQASENLRLIGNADTTAALDFRNDLTATQLLLDIEIGDTNFRLERLRDFLAVNY